MASVCVFCGSRSGHASQYTNAARQIAETIVQAGLTTVYGGGSVGIMGTIADVCLAADAPIIGVIPQALADVELMHPDVTQMRVVPDMHARKALMHQLSDGYLALPGGFGTMEELFEVLCWSQLNLHQSPIAVFNQNGLFDPLITLAEQMVVEGFLDAESRSLMSVLTSVSEVRQWLSELPAEGA
ncbi:MAG: TIGR00730 family Rossman fold protein [Planctomycetaceae bacterium]|nr:TIGR00730 family Rossman fold protein [Planctomycetaceae bacterium]